MNPPTLSLLVLKTPAPERLRDFYAALGVAFKQEQHGSGPLHFAGQLGSLVLEIYPSENPADTSTRLGFVVDSLQDRLETLQLMQVTLVSPRKETEWGLRAVVRDPDGRAIELYQGQ